MRIALATMRSLPAWEVDDRPLVAALEQRGAAVEQPIWNDPAVDWGRFDGVLIRSTWDYYVQRDAFVAWAERVASETQLWNPAPVVQWNTHKSYLHDLQRRNVALTPTAWLTRGARVDIAELCEQRGWKRAFLKPMVGCTARETLRFTADVDGIERARAHVARLLPKEDLMLQPYFESVERVGELSIVAIDGTPSHAVRKIPKPGDYRVQDDFGAQDEPAELGDVDLDVAMAIVAAAERELELTDRLLYARIDMLIDDAGQPRLNELELVEPSLFFRHEPRAAVALAEGLLARVSASG